jgi:ParB-like chromosome segregation protein Spo0J
MAARSREENERLDRLAGSGKGWGGGLPLPLLLAAILNELLDNGAASTRHLTQIASSVLDFKTRQVMSTWDTWEDFTADVLAQMEAKGVILHDEGMWSGGPALETGTYIEIIPARHYQGRKYPSDGVTVWEKAERERRSRAEHLEREATSLVGRFRPATPEHVAEIRQSETQVGQLYPVLVDQHGRILDGGHRKAANPNWREHKITVESEEMALTISLWANSGKPLPPKVQARVTELIGELAGTSRIKRDRAAAALRADPSRSNRDIARQVGCSPQTVAEVRRDLEETAQIEQFSATGGRGVTTGVPAPPSRPRGPIGDVEGARAETYRRVRAGQPVRRQEVARKYGVSEINVRVFAREALAVIAAEDEATEPPVHVHSWGLWTRFRCCDECGEQQTEAGDESADAHP